MRMIECLTLMQVNVLNIIVDRIIIKFHLMKNWFSENFWSFGQGHIQAGRLSSIPMLGFGTSGLRTSLVLYFLGSEQ